MSELTIRIPVTLYSNNCNTPLQCIGGSLTICCPAGEVEVCLGYFIDFAAFIYWNLGSSTRNFTEVLVENAQIENGCCLWENAELSLTILGICPPTRFQFYDYFERDSSLGTFCSNTM